MTKIGIAHIYASNNNIIITLDNTTIYCYNLQTNKKRGRCGKPKC